VANMQKNGYASGPEDASAKAINGGLDVYGGWNDNLWGQGYLLKAIELNMTTAAAVTRAVRRTLMQKMKVGLFDPVENQTWTKIGLKDLNSSYSQQVAFEMALQGLVLLKNAKSAYDIPTHGGEGEGDGGAARPLLPLTPAEGLRLAVVGPMAFETTGLKSDYANSNLPAGCCDSIAAALSRVNEAAGGHTTTAKGVNVADSDASGEAAALAAVSAADVTVMVLGITRDQEHEGIDRKDTLLPGIQEGFAQKVLASGKPVVLVTVSGGILSIDSLINGSAAIIDAFNPFVQGPRAIAETIFGMHNRWGKMPVTVYPANYSTQLPIQEMSLTKAPGRSYRYYDSSQGKALFEFGQGLSYTSFSVTVQQRPQETAQKSGTVAFSFDCVVTNTGDRHGDEVVLVYHQPQNTLRAQLDGKHPIPLKRLIGFERVALAAGAKTSIPFTFNSTDLSLIDETGAKQVYPGTHGIVFSHGNGPETTIDVRIPALL